MTNAYRAVFQAKPRNVDIARRNFQLRFGDDIYDKYIKNYFDRSQGHKAIFSAPHTWYKWWLINRLQELDAQSNDEYTFEPAPDYVFFVETEKHGTCTECGSLMDYPFVDRDRDVQDICYPCWIEGREKLLDEFEEKLHENHKV